MIDDDLADMTAADVQKDIAMAKANWDGFMSDWLAEKERLAIEACDEELLNGTDFDGDVQIDIDQDWIDGGVYGPEEANEEK